MYTAGGTGFLHDMLETAGGANVFADVRRQSLQLTSELLLTRSPDVIVEIRSGPGARSNDRDAWRALSAVPAVRDGRVYLFTDEFMSIPGPRVPEAVLTIAKTLHPDVFVMRQ